MPIVWPEPTHAAPASLVVKAKKLKPWRTAAECIDWSIQAPSIFERSKPLAEATCRRIAKGIMRYVVQSPNPFIVSTLIQTGYGERAGQSPRVPGLDKPMGTLVGSQKHALVSAFLAKHYTGVVGSDMAAPVATVTSVDHHSLVTANMIHMGHGEGKNGGKRFSHGIRSVTEPVNTITASGSVGALITSNLVKLRGDNVGSATDEPLHTISAQGTHHAEVRAFLIKYYGTDQDPAMREPLHTITTKDRFGLVTVRGEEYAIVDIGLRMLTPRELYRAQGFPEGYQIDFGADGKPLTKTAQVRMCGNSVCPPLSCAIVSANYAEAAKQRKAA